MKFLYTIILIAFLVNLAFSSCDSDHKTICDYSNGTKSCCPIKDGVCCQDSNYCCPKGFECDSKNNRCLKDSLFIPFHLKVELFDKDFQLSEPIGKDILCPDNQTTCKETQTCCLFGEADYGCCPLAHAICCEDKVHCCPKNYKCNPSKGKCDRVSVNLEEMFSINWFKKQSGNKLNSVQCPDGKSECPSGSTCCQLSSGNWGCCPIPDAVCCEDHLHCCPHGYVCDIKDGRCNKGLDSIPLYKKTESTKKYLKNTCPGGESECPDGSTCCQLSSGDWGCCPISDAVCCEDHLHCCPNGYVCDIKDGRCNKGEISIPFLSKIEARQTKSKEILKEKEKFEANSVVCPDGSSFCPNKFSCCKMSDGSYGCCPLPNAVCCEDHLHCCPSGTHCNLQKQSCDNEDFLSVSWLEKIPSKLLYDKNSPKVAADPIVCDDNITTCDPLKTCCKMADDTYGCCPFSDGVCCSELSYCCPGNTVCGKVYGECLNKMNIMQKIELKAKIIDKNEINYCDGIYCGKPDGGQLCCPYENGTCCGTHGFCCPLNYNCNPKDETCTYNDPELTYSTPMPIQISSKRSKRLSEEFDEEIDLTMVECQDTIHFCPDSSTCCKTKETYGCCAIKEAVCCEDGINCCPSGFTCSTNSTSSTCIKKKPGTVLLN